MHTQRLKKLRIEIDYVLQLLRFVTTYSDALRMKAFDNLKLSKMWLGKVLGELKDTTNPYPNSMNPGNQIVEPEADCFKGPVSLKDVNIISCIKEVRRLIENLLPEYDAVLNIQNITGNIPYITYANESKLRLIEAKLWLGVELGEFRDADIDKQNVNQISQIKDFQNLNTMECGNRSNVDNKAEHLGRWPVDRKFEEFNGNKERR